MSFLNAFLVISFSFPATALASVRGLPPGPAATAIVLVIGVLVAAGGAYGAFKNFSSAVNEEHSVGQGLTILCAAGATSAFLIYMATN